MFKFFNFKKKIESNKNSLPDLNEIKKDLENKIDKINFSYQSKIEKLKEEYLTKFKEDKQDEEDLDLYDLIVNAKFYKMPLVCDLVHFNNYNKTYHINKGFKTSNPYSINISNFNNCVFLKAVYNNYEIITIYYDKILKNYSEYHWEYNVLPLKKNVIYDFLVELIELALKDGILFSKYTISSSKEKENYLNELLATESELKNELNSKIDELSINKENEITEAKNDYYIKIKPYEEEMLEKRMLKTQNEININNGFINGNKNINEIDNDVYESINKLFLRLETYFKSINFLDSESKYEVETLYNKDVQELFLSYLSLSKENQIKEKNRFLNLVEAIHLSLNNIEERINLSNNFDFEKKIKYLENKYKK